MKEEAQRADRLAEAAKDADAGLAQQLEAETARRGGRGRARVAARGLAAAAARASTRTPAARAVVDAAHVAAQPGAAGRPGRRVPRALRRGVAAVAWEDGASSPVNSAARGRRARRARAGWSPGFVVKSRRSSGAGPPPPLTLAALYGARAGAGGERPSPTAPSPSRRRATTAAAEVVSSSRLRRAPLGRQGSATRWTRSSTTLASPVAAALAATLRRPHQEDIADAVPSSRNGLLERANNQKMMLRCRDAERRQPRLGEDRGIKTGDGGPAVAASGATACTPTTRARLQLGKRPAADVRPRRSGGRATTSSATRRRPSNSMCDIFCFSQRLTQPVEKIPAPSNSQQNS